MKIEPSDYATIRNTGGGINGQATWYTIFSDNDPYVPLDNQDDFKIRLGSKIIIDHNKGHFKHAFTYDTTEDAYLKNIYRHRRTKCGWTIRDIIGLTLRIVRLRLRYGERLTDKRYRA